MATPYSAVAEGVGGRGPARAHDDRDVVRTAEGGREVVGREGGEGLGSVPGAGSRWDANAEPAPPRRTRRGRGRTPVHARVIVIGRRVGAAPTSLDSGRWRSPSGRPSAPASASSGSCSSSTCETRELSPGANEILEQLRPEGAEEHPKAKHELLQSTVEIITGICTTVAEAKADLAGTLAEVAAAAEQRGLGADVRGHPPVHRLAEPAHLAQGALPRARRADAVDGPPAADLRRPRARRRAGAGEGDPDRQRAVPVHPALPRAVVVLTVLGRLRHRPRLVAHQDLRGHADGGAALPAGRLGAVRGVHGDADLHEVDRERPRGVVGHPAAPRLRHRRAAHLRRPAHPRRDRRGRRARPVPGRAVRHPARPRLHPADAGVLGAAGEQVAGRPLRAGRRHRRRREGHRPAGAAGDPRPGRGAAARPRSGWTARPSWATSLRVLDVGASYQRQRAVAAAHGRRPASRSSTACWPRCGTGCPRPARSAGRPSRSPVRPTAPGGTRRDRRRRGARRRGGRLGRGARGRARRRPPAPARPPGAGLRRGARRRPTSSSGCARRA